MANPRRPKRRVVILVLSVIAIVAWLYYQHSSRIDLAAYVPQTAIGFLELNDWTRLVDDLTSSKGWADLAPAYGIWDQWKHLGLAARAIRSTGIGTSDHVILARSQFGLFITSLEVTGDEVRPRLAFIAETHSSPRRLESVINRILPQLAHQILGETTEEASVFQETPVRVFRAKSTERRLYSTQIEGEWIVANHTEAVEAAINTRKGRVASLTNDENLAKARSGDSEGPGLFAFVTGEGTSRLARFSASLFARRVLGESTLLESLESVVADLTSKVSQGLAYRLRFENGIAVETWRWLCPPDMAHQLREGIQPRNSEAAIIKRVPEVATGVTLVNVEDPKKGLETLEAVVSARMGAAQSFLFHRFLIGAREALFGFKEGESAAGILGNEIAIASLGPQSAEQAWLINVVDRSRLDPIVERFLSSGGARIVREVKSGYLILTSSDERRGAVAFLEDIVSFGSRGGIERLVEARSDGKALVETNSFRSASKPSQKGMLASFSSDVEETQKMMEALAAFLPRGVAISESGAALERVPLSASSVRLEDWGILTETHSTFGSLTWLSVVGGR
jgi:hypothetical protein